MYLFGPQGSGLRVEDSGFRVEDSGFRVSCLGFRDSGFRVLGLGFRVQSFGLVILQLPARFQKLSLPHSKYAPFLWKDGTSHSPLLRDGWFCWASSGS